MATEIIVNDPLPSMHVIAINGKEAADLIGLLAAQLAGVSLVNNAAGAAPTINIVENGVVKYKLILCLDNKHLDKNTRQT